jgi:glycosyltransferase involved in cell wall biosynthesis
MNTATSHPPRVLMVTPRFFPLIGGVETHVDQVSRRLARLGAAITVLTTDPSGRLPRREERDGVTIERVRAWPARRDYYFAPGVWDVITGGSWDLLHCQSYHTLVAPLAMAAALRSRLPYVVTFHGGGHSSRLRNALRGAQWALLRPLLARASRLVAVAGFEIALYARRLGVPADRFALIPNGADLPSTAQPLPPLNDRPLIVTVGRLERYKGHQRVIAALPLVLQRYPQARLRIVGAGPYEAHLWQLARELGVASQVTIGGIDPTDRQAMADVLAQSSVVALLSEYETHPIAALEALALGRPLVAADTSGLGELARRGLVRAVPLPCAPELVAAGIVEQLREPLLPAAIDLPSWDDCAAGLLALYHSIVERPAICAS